MLKLPCQLKLLVPRATVIFDTKGSEPSGYQSLPPPCYEGCSASSIAKSTHPNDYYIEEDAEDCELALEKIKEVENEEKLKECDEHYCKLIQKHFE